MINRKQEQIFMDDLAATYAKLINLDHVSPLNDIATAHTTQSECVCVCVCFCVRLCVLVWVKRRLPGAVGDRVYDPRGTEAQNP